MYDYIDIRKDGIIDLNEWNKIFAKQESILDVTQVKKNQFNQVIIFVSSIIRCETLSDMLSKNNFPLLSIYFLFSSINDKCSSADMAINLSIKPSKLC